jgi:hypothetical protein
MTERNSKFTSIQITKSGKKRIDGKKRKDETYEEFLRRRGVA